MAISVGDAVLKLGVDTKTFDKDMKGLGASIKKHQRAIGIGMVAMGGAIVAMGVASVKAYANMGDEVHKMSLRTGFATETLSRLKYAAAIGGASLADVEKAAKRMSTTILDAKDGLAETVRQLDRLGLAVEDFEGLSPEEQFMMLAEALSNVEDASERAAIAQKVFGRAGTALLPMLAEGTEGLKLMMAEAEKFGPIFDQEAAEAAAKLTDQLGQLKGASDKLKTQIAEQLVPILIPLIEDIKDLTIEFFKWTKEHPELTRKIVLLTGGVGALLIPLGTLLIMLPILTKGFGSLRAAALLLNTALIPIALIVGAISVVVWEAWTLWRLMTGQLDEFIDEATGTTDILGVLKHDFKDLTDQFSELSKEVLPETTDAVDDLERELAELEDETEDYTESLTGSEGLVSASNEATDAFNDQYDALHDLNKKFADWRREMIYDRSEAGRLGITMDDIYSALFDMEDGVDQVREGMKYWGDDIGNVNSALEYLLLEGFDVLALLKAQKEAADEAGDSYEDMADGIDKAAEATASYASRMAAAYGLTGSQQRVEAAISATAARRAELVAGGMSPKEASRAASLETGRYVEITEPTTGYKYLGYAPGVIPGKYAEGGIAMRPILGTIGEKGPEAVIPLDRLDRMLGGKTVNIYVELDGRIIAKAVGQPLVDEIRLRTGVHI